MFYVVRERYKKNKQTNKALPITGRKNTKEKFEINSVMLNIDDMEHLLRGLSTQMSKLLSWAKFSLILPKAHIN